MKKIGIIYFLLVTVLFVLPDHAKGQPPLKGLNIHTILPGYKAKVVGEYSSFHSSSPDVNDGMITRANGTNAIVWTTANIPAGYTGKYVYFVWLTGLATGNNRQNSSYDMYINDKKHFDIKVTAKQLPQNWQLKGPDDTELSFVQHSADANKDCFGYMYLKVPVASYTKGKPLTLKINAVNSGRYDDFIIVFQHEEKEQVTVKPRLLLRRQNNQLQQLVAVQVNHVSPDAAASKLSYDEQAAQDVKLNPGFNEFELWVPAVKSAQKSLIKFNAPQLLSFAQNIALQPVAKRQLYLVNHSHNDIGYSDYQPVVARKQNDYIRLAMKLIEKSKNQPKEARFIWNIEAMWAVENFMEVATEEEKAKLVEYAKSGSIGLPAGYANLITGICRPEELVHLTDYSNLLKRKHGLSSQTLMISDVPGMSWNVVSALKQRGVKYISSGPNYIPHDGFPDNGGRVGATHKAWGDKPFYWVSASGRDTVLYWQAGTGYSMFQDWNTGRLTFDHKPMTLMMNYMQKLQDEHYPYEMVQMRYSIINDNQTPDEGISDIVEAWNKKYESPKLVIANVEDMMKTFEARYKNTIPVESGDFTPYWEDGAMSTAREEVLTKQAVERLYQSEVLNTLLFPGNYNEDKYYQAWRNAVLWHEHTWGAWNSVSQPDAPGVARQWEYKRDFALRADSLSRELVKLTVNDRFDSNTGFECINTSSWNRTDLVMLSKEQSTAGDVIVDEKGNKYPSQRLSDGRLAFLAKDVPALGKKKFFNKRGASNYKSDLKINGLGIENDDIKLVLDKSTGAISSLVNKKTGKEFVDGSRYQGLNQFLYMPGLDPSKALTAAGVQISIIEKGPLVATFEIVAKNAPGTKGLKQQVSLVNELNKVDMVDMVDKLGVREKESVHFAFPVNVPGGQIRMDIGTGVLLPGKNQLPGANKDYISLQRWVDVSDKNTGLTFITHEVPLVEQGDLVNEMPAASSSSFGGTSSEKKWKDSSSTSNTFFSYTMNNYWYTNYKAEQEGPVTFRYAIYLHDEFDSALAGRMGTANAQPLLVAAPKTAVQTMPFVLNNPNILLTAAKPAWAKNGVILRFYNASSTAQKLGLGWKNAKGKIYLSNANEEKVQLFDMNETWPAFSLKTLYLEY